VFECSSPVIIFHRSASIGYIINNILKQVNCVNASPRIISCLAADDYAGLVCDNNVMVSSNPNLVFNGTADRTYAQFQADGFEAAGLNQDVPFISGTLIPVTAVESADDLGATLDDGLDVSMLFASETSIETLVTKQQPATWQNGAYVK